jgi:hypothetical protein
MKDFGFRQLPCKTFISSGICPYRDRCQYLHDPRVMCFNAQNKIRTKSKGDKTTDALFWPNMPFRHLCFDKSNEPQVLQQYNVPPPRDNMKHDEAIYSIWMHFVEFCYLTTMADRVGQGFFYHRSQIVNKYTKKKRLQIFIALAAC